MYVRNPGPFSPAERSEEIKELANGFRAAVMSGSVFKQENDGYALSSSKRDMDIPTSTAPGSIEGSMAILVRDLKESHSQPSLYIADNLAAAVASIKMAESFLESGRSPLMPAEAQSVLANVRQALPGMAQLAHHVKNGL